MKIYVVDSNFFIQAHRATYPIDVATSFWAKVRELALSGVIVSIDKVKNELFDKNDVLEEWCIQNLPPTFFMNSSETIQEYSKVSSWAASKSRHYHPSALSEFLDVNEADAFLVAFALKDPQNRIIITHEVSQPAGKRKIKIPEPCDALGITFMNTMQMFRELGITF